MSVPGQLAGPGYHKQMQASVQKARAPALLGVRLRAMGSVQGVGCRVCMQ